MIDIKCIVAIVERGKADKVVDAAKKKQELLGGPLYSMVEEQENQK